MRGFHSAARLCVLALCASGTLTACKKADAPSFSPAPGTYIGTQYVAMSSPTPGAIIIYTTDGSAPSCVKERGTIYSAPVAVAKNTTLKAMACALLRDESPITTGAYVIKPPEPVANPVFAPAGGLYLAAQSVSISTATTDATIRYTSDGTAPSCTSGTVYAGPIDVAQDVTLSAIGCATGKPDSAVVSAELHHPAARCRTGFRSGAGRVHRRAARHADVRDTGRDVQVQHRWPEPGLRRQHALRRPHRDQQFADAQGRGLRDQPLRQPGHQRRLRHHAAARELGVEEPRLQQSRGESADLRRRLAQHQ